ncbi:hypothetical protein [Rhizobium sp. FY34]|uniref:hypothetical protein n=1 Tax=Rhizobium sp. FY34 TaxID=2562309 RepID=UPI0010BFA149|nr:hypothetical protein [Rhizobium sp. FY34]
MDTTDKTSQKGREPTDDATLVQTDMMSLKARQEAARLGSGDIYMVKSDLDEIDERTDGDAADGHVSPMANADNPER